MITAWSCLRRGPTPLDSYSWTKLPRRKPGNFILKQLTENILTVVADPDPAGAHSFELMDPDPDVQIAPCSWKKKMVNTGTNIYSTYSIVFISGVYIFSS
jgi:hypothetical protein